VTTTTPRPSPADARADHRAWRDARLAQLASSTGHLALVETRWLPAGVSAADALAALPPQPATVTVTTLDRSNLDTGEPEEGLRFWDSASPAIAAFDTVSAFDYDPDWVVDAQFTPVAGDRTVPFEHIRDNGGSRELAVPGDIRFHRDGVDYTLSAFDDEGTLLLAFGDTTNRRSDDSATYPTGRFLRVQRAGGAGFGDAGRVTLDFNRAYVPPCGFSVQFNCPLPPVQNRFAVPVEAGERQVVFADGFDVYAATLL
jgi:uncharacterized protein (DUF1684 family)